MTLTEPASPNGAFLDHIDAVPAEPKPVDRGFSFATYTAAELEHQCFPPIHWVLPDTMPEGLTLLIGKPKLGKSWFALDVAIAVARGGECLGRDCDPGSVLYLALEDNARRMQRRMRKIVEDGGWPARLSLVHEAPRLDQGGLEAIEDWLDRHPDARLVIVDTLGAVKPPSRASDGVHASDYAALRGLHGIANQRGVGVMVVHHARKADADDPFDSVSGSTGLTGAADTTLILTRRDHDGGVVLYGRGRDLEEIERAIEFDADTCRWRDLGDPAEAYASDTRQAIFAAIRGGHETPKEIEEATGMEGATIRQQLQRMSRVGDVRKVERGRYAL